MADIAVASNITKPVLYDHFPSKEDLYVEVCKEIRERLLAAGTQVMTDRNTPARIRAGVEAFFTFAEKNPAAIRILLSPPRDEKRLYRAIQQIQDHATQAITDMFLAIGVPAPKDEATAQRLAIQAEFFKRGLHALGQWRVEHPAVSKETVVDAISGLVFRGLSAQK
jgi:AcrR family transcriptional regulator